MGKGGVPGVKGFGNNDYEGKCVCTFEWPWESVQEPRILRGGKMEGKRRKLGGERIRGYLQKDEPPHPPERRILAKNMET